MTVLVPGIATLEQGFECSDMDSFYSSVTGGFGNRASREADGRTTRVRLAHGELLLRTGAAAGRLVHDIEFVTDTWLYDLVARWVLPADIAADGRIGAHGVPFGSLLYHQHPVLEVALGSLRIEWIDDTEIPAGMRAETYLRSEPGRWIVHARAIAHGPAAVPFVKHTDGHSTRFDGDEIERRVLWRRRELAAPIYDTQIQPHVRIAAGTRARIGLASTLGSTEGSGP